MPQFVKEHELVQQKKNVGNTAPVDPSDPAAQLLASTKSQNSTLIELSAALKKSHKIEALIGKGSMGPVYKARNLLLNRYEALKILPEPQTDEGMASLQEQASALSFLIEPNIGAVYNVGVLQNGKPYILMEYIEGVALSTIIERDQPLNEDWIIYIFSQLCTAIDKAHEAGIVHGDIKPENVLITTTKSGFDGAKVIDFGIAKNSSKEQDRLGSDTVLGAPPYMSPEQFEPSPATYQSDIYALGCVLYTMLTGKPPFEAESTFEIARMHQELPPPTIAKQYSYFQPTFDKALAKDPAARYTSCLAMWQELYNRLWTTWRRPAIVIPRNRIDFLSKSRKPLPGLRSFVGVFWCLAAVILLVWLGELIAPTSHKSIWLAILAGFGTAFGVTVWKARLKYPFIRRG